MFDPKTICVIGASSKLNSVGYCLMKNLVGTGYEGTVYPVNPNRQNVLGIHCYKSIAELPEKADLAIIATPSFTVPQIVKECVKAEAKSIIVLSSGFSEIGKEGLKLELELKKILEGTGIRLLGPNCLGYIRTDKKINASFAIRNALPGKMALISQSGALCSSILDWALKQHVGFKYFISVGAMLNTGFSDLIDFIQQDPEVESIAIYMETIKDAKKFMSAARSFAKSKPIIVAKSGKFFESAKAAISHTGSMAGNDEVFEAAFRRAGIVRVENILDLLGCSEALAKQALPKGNRIAIITNAGGPGVMAVDAVIKQGCGLAGLSKSAFAALEKAMPSHWSRGNPIDLLGDADAERYSKALDIVLKEDSIDGIIVIFSPQAVSKPDAVAGIVAEKARNAKKTILACWMGESFVEPARQILRRQGLPCYKTPEEAVRVFGYMNSYRENILQLYETPAEVEFSPKPDEKKIREKIAEYINKKTLVLNELDSKQILFEYGIPVNKTIFARNAKEAVSTARQIGFPVALKAVSSEITHKTDANAVALDLVSEKEVEASFNEIVRNAKKACSNAKIFGVTVQEMIPPGSLELIVGLKKDNIFGPVLLFGLGGISTEIFSDTSIGLPPLTQTLARRMIENTRVSRLLHGERKKFKIDISELEKLLVKFSQFAVDFPEVQEVDINPIMVSSGKLFAVDARIILSKDALQKESLVAQLAIAPYPAEFEKAFKIGKTRFLFRPIKPEDEPKASALFKSLSKQAMRQRFFHTIKKMTPEALTRYCFGDYAREIPIAAELLQKGKPFAAVGRLALDAGGKTAEFAIVVASKFQKKRLGEKILGHLEKIARKKGLEKLWSIVSIEDKAMIALAKKAGYSAKKSIEEKTILLEKKIAEKKFVVQEQRA